MINVDSDNRAEICQTMIIGANKAFITRIRRIVVRCLQTQFDKNWTQRLVRRQKEILTAKSNNYSRVCYFERLFIPVDSLDLQRWHWSDGGWRHVVLIPTISHNFRLLQLYHNTRSYRARFSEMVNKRTRNTDHVRCICQNNSSVSQSLPCHLVCSGNTNLVVRCSQILHWCFVFQFV